MATKHDQLLKKLLASFPAQFLHLAAPRIADRVDLDTIEFSSEEHYPGSPTGRERRPDLVARVSALPEGDGDRDGEAEVVVLHAEIELQFRTKMAPRLLGYHRGLSLEHSMVVHTIVLYLRGGPPGPQPAVYEERSLGEAVVVFRYHSFGLSRAAAAEYLVRQEPLAWALAALMRPAKGQSRPRLGLACVRRIAHARELTDVERDLLFECVMRYASLQDLEAWEFDKMLAETENEEVQTMTTTMMEWWRKQGREQGREQGQAEGRKQGRAEGWEQGRRDLVLRLLTERFGGISAETQRKVSAIDSAEELTRLAARMFQVQSLEELGLG